MLLHQSLMHLVITTAKNTEASASVAFMVAATHMVVDRQSLCF